MTRAKFSIACMLLLSIANCNSDAPSYQLQLGRARFGVNLITLNVPGGRITPTIDEVALVTALISWNGGSTPEYAMTQTGPGTYEIEIGLLPVNQPLQFHSTARNNEGETVFAGSIDSFWLNDVESSNFVIDLFPVFEQIPNTPPRVLNMGRPINPIHVNNIIMISFDVLDPNDSSLQYLLSASSGTFLKPVGVLDGSNEGATLKAVYVAPSTPGNVTITGSFTDAAGFTASTSAVLVVLPPVSANDGTTGSGFATNFAPTIHGVEISASDSASELQLFADASDDQPSSELEFTWVIDNAHILMGNPVNWTANVGIVPVLLQVQDARGVVTTIVFDLDTTSSGFADLPNPILPPQITGATLSQQDVSYGQDVVATIYANDPQFLPLSPQWTTTWGSIVSTTAHQANGGWVFSATWRGGTEPNSANLTALISNVMGGQIQYTFVINQVDGQISLTANAGADQTVFSGQSFVLNGGNSVSGDGQILTYLWEQLAGPASAIAMPQAVTTAVTPSTIGTYLYRLTVTNANNISTDTVVVSVTNPTQFGFVEADEDSSGVIYFLDSTSRLVRRYDAASQQWLPSFDTANVVTSMAIVPNGSLIYTGVEGGRIDVTDTMSGARSTFAQNSGTVNEMVVADAYLFTQDTIGSVTSRGLFNRLTGIRTAYATASYRTSQLIYSSLVSKVFHLRDGVSPNDIMFVTINQLNGTFTAAGDSPYHGDYSLGYPLRLFPDQSKLAVAPGHLFNTANLTIAGSFGQSYVDLCFFGVEPRIIKASGSDTQVLFLNTDNSVARIEIVPGAPLRVFEHNGLLYVISSNGPNHIRVTTIGAGI